MSRVLTPMRSRRYIMVGERGDPFSLGDFLAANADWPLPASDLKRMRALRVGETHGVGGGAGAAFTIKRIR